MRVLALLARALPGYDSADFVNGNAAPGDRALGLGFEHVRHYLDIPFDSWRGIPELRPLSQIQDPYLLARALHEEGYDWLMLHLKEPHNQEAYRYSEFAERYGKLVFREGDYVVYRLTPAP